MVCFRFQNDTMKKRSLPLLLFAFAGMSYGVRTVLFPAPAHFPPPVYDFAANPLSDEKIRLGRVLFYDPLLSKDGSISCASCHSPYNAFAHTDHALSHGIGDRVGSRNAPALMNLAWQKSFMWDGAVAHLVMPDVRRRDARLDEVEGALVPDALPAVEQILQHGGIRHDRLPLRDRPVASPLPGRSAEGSGVTGGAVLPWCKRVRARTDSPSPADLLYAAPSPAPGAGRPG